ncbi:MAG: hypothetical protein ABI068_00265 [Ktedonobacterales bacterium]
MRKQTRVGRATSREAMAYDTLLWIAPTLAGQTADMWRLGK